ncbi:flavin-containing monooxygenase [Blastopirellula retiformator]|uniref:4-hydroxyacetophenone monooxygenase n=1 Tax=Blastopirellula retiformator TaxID=2527970 RepID=A0A5C5VAC2_9BACT|nr:NAD(P)-binding domain-containing protein [Blastopirellula retiformator]TWT34867.1 4-hydroxyacetophenone monooxygenase [Blastopirellula retiformator]
MAFDTVASSPPKTKKTTARPRSVFAKWLATPDPASPSEATPTVPGLPILVVGAGPAGLSGMAALAKQGIDFVGVESHRQVGGIWDISNPISSAYEGLRTVTSRFTTFVGESPAAGDVPNFIPHEQAFEQFKAFAQSHRLVDKIKFETSFVDARKSEAGTWQVKLRPTGADHDKQEYEQEFRGIIFATGSHNQKHGRMPVELAAQARDAGIEVLHSSEYKTPERFAGKRVLIVGLGDSASDIAAKICSTTARTILGVRTPPWLIPQVVMGVPVDKLGHDTNWLPNWYRDGSLHMIRWAYIGGHRRLGMSSPKHGLHDKMAILDRGIVAAIRSGGVVVRSNVTGFADGVANFASEEHAAEPIDAVIFATGFSRSYPLLCQPGASENEIADALSFRIFHPTEAGLFYLAETIGLRSCWPIFTEQTNAIVAYLQNEECGTSNLRRFNQRRQVETPPLQGAIYSMCDRFHLDYEIYTSCLRDFSAWLAE